MPKEIGRPKKTLNDLPKNWKEKLLELYRNGGSDTNAKCWIADKIGSISNDLWYRWMDEEEAFSEAITLGRLYSQQWWELIGRESLVMEKGKSFSAAVWQINMRNRFDWDKGDKLNQDIRVTIIEDGEDS